MKLHTRPASFRAQRIIVAATYGGIGLEINTSAQEKSLNALAPFVKLPLLETKEGGIVESAAIARYIASKGSKRDQLLGKDDFSAAQISSWMEFCANDVEVPATVCCYPIIGWMELHNEAFTKAKKDLNSALQTLDSHLKTKTFLVGEQITLADITVATTLLLPFKLLFDEKLRKTFPCVTRWFLTCVNQPEFLKVIGSTTLATEALVPKGYKAPTNAKKSGKEKKEKSKPKAAETAPEPAPAPTEIPAEKKEKHYCESLPKSNFILDSWKRTYSNARDCYAVMPTFWQDYDPEGWCLYRGDYKYNNELKVPFMVSNLAGGFVQRCDEIRKYGFGVLQILEKDGKMKMISAWLFRGDSEKLMLDANPDAESWSWTKIDHTDADKKKMVEEIWCAGETLEGMNITDAKVFK